MKPLSLNAYAAQRGVTQEAVRLAVKDGRLAKSITYVNGKPKIADAVMADKEWAENTDQSKPRNRITGDPKHRRAPGEATKAMENSIVSGTNGPSYAQSRAIREAYQARLAKLEFEEKSGKLVSRDDVRVAAFNAARKARDSLLSIPDRIAPILAGITDDREVHRILTDEIRRVCSEMTSRAHGTAH